MKKKVILFLTLLAAGVLTSYPQEPDILDRLVEVSKEKDALEKETEELKSQIESLQTLLQLKNDTISRQIEMIGEVTDSAGSLKRELNQKDNNIKLLEDSIAVLLKQSAELDLIRFKFANGRLFFAYNKKNADESIQVFNQITDPQIKNKYRDLKTAFRDFPTEQQSVLVFLQKLQNSLEGKTKAVLTQWKEETLPQINKFNAGRQKYNNGIRIYFLEDIMEEVSERVARTGRDYKPDFEDLIIKLSLKEN